MMRVATSNAAKLMRNMMIRYPAARTIPFSPVPTSHVRTNLAVPAMMAPLSSRQTETPVKRYCGAKSPVRRAPCGARVAVRTTPYPTTNATMTAPKLPEAIARNSG